MAPSNPQIVLHAERGVNNFKFCHLLRKGFRLPNVEEKGKHRYFIKGKVRKLPVDLIYK